MLPLENKDVKSVNQCSAEHADIRNHESWTKRRLSSPRKHSPLRSPLLHPSLIKQRSRSPFSSPEFKGKSTLVPGLLS